MIGNRARTNFQKPFEKSPADFSHSYFSCRNLWHNIALTLHIMPQSQACSVEKVFEQQFLFLDKPSQL